MNRYENLPSINLYKNRIAELEKLEVIFGKNEQIDKLKKQLNDYIELISNFNKTFSSRGWIAYESMNTPTLEKALKVAKSQNIDKAEKVLIEYYQSSIVQFSISRLWGVEEFRDRLRLIKMAYYDHICGRYHSSVPILLMMIDGVFADANNNTGFFSEKSDVTSWDSIVGDDAGLQVLKSIFFKMRGTTNKNKIILPYRNGIMHGRDIGYANEDVSAKCWALLFAVRDLLYAKKDEANRRTKYDIESQKTFEDIINDNKILMSKLEESINIDSFKRIPVKAGIDYPFSENSSQYNSNSPEKLLVEFFETWSKKNYGDMASFIYRSNYITLGQMKGRISKEFRGKDIISFSLVSSNDISPCCVEILSKIQISYKSSNNLEYHLNFRLLYCELESTELVVNTNKEGIWRIVNNFNVISEIGTPLDGLEHLTE